MANLTNHINLNTSWGGGDVTAGDAIRIDAGNEVNVKFDNTSITLNGDWELQATLPIHCIEDYPATVEWEIIINGCGCTAGELYRAVDDSDYYPAETKYIIINKKNITGLLTPESWTNFYLKKTVPTDVYTTTKVHDYKTNVNRYSSLYDDKPLCSTDMLDSVVKEIMTGSHNTHVLNCVIAPAISYRNIYRSFWFFKFTSIIDWTTCYWQAMHSLDELTAAWWSTYQVTYFQNSILAAITSINPSILNVNQFFENYTIIDSINNYSTIAWHTIIIADNSTNKPVMYACISYGSGSDYECVYYKLNKTIEVFSEFRTYPKSWYAMMLYYYWTWPWDDATRFARYEYVLETTNQIISSGTIDTSWQEISTGMGWEDVCSSYIYSAWSNSSILWSNMNRTSQAMWEPGGLVWEPVANCPEPEPEISIEAGDAIRIDDGTEVNVKFDGTTITLNDNGELQATGGWSSDCACIPWWCWDEKPTPQEAWEIYVSTCWNDAWVIYRAVEDIYVDTWEPALVLRKKTASSSSAWITTSQSNLQTLFVGTGDYKLFFKASIDWGELTKNFITFASDIEEMQRISPSITSYYNIANKTITRDVSKGAASNVDANVYYYAPNAPLFPTDQWLQYKQNLYKYDYNYNVWTWFFTVRGNSEYIASVFDVKQSWIPTKVDDSTTRARVLYAMLWCGSATEALEHYNIYRYMVSYSWRYRSWSWNPASMLLIIPKWGTYPVAACLWCSPDYMGWDTRILTRKDFVFDKYVAEDWEVIYVQQDSFADPKQLSPSSYYSSHNQPSKLMIKVDSSNNITAMCSVNTNLATSWTYPNVHHSYTYLIAGYTAASMSITWSLRREPVSTQKVNDLQIELDDTKSHIESLQQAIADLNTRVTALENA